MQNSRIMEGRFLRSVSDPSAGCFTACLVINKKSFIAKFFVVFKGIDATLFGLRLIVESLFTSSCKLVPSIQKSTGLSGVLAISGKLAKFGVCIIKATPNKYSIFNLKK